MLVLADRSGRFGKVSTMTLIASLGTRIKRSSPLSGFVTGAGYDLGDFVFDYLFFTGFTLRGQCVSEGAGLFISSLASGFVAIVPYLLFRFTVLSPEAFVTLIPVYAVSTIKGIFFSVIVTSIGLTILDRIKEVV